MLLANRIMKVFRIVKFWALFKHISFRDRSVPNYMLFRQIFDSLTKITDLHQLLSDEMSIQSLRNSKHC